MNNIKIDLLENFIAQFKQHNPEEPKYLLLPEHIYQTLQFQLQIMTHRLDDSNTTHALAFYKDIMIFKVRTVPDPVFYSQAEFHSVVQKLLYHTGV